MTCFVLRYRLVHATTTDPITELGGKWGTKEFEEQVRVVQQMATADGRAAISYVREHAAEYGIDPKKIGIIGFSAGSGLAEQISVGEIGKFLAGAMFKTGDGYLDLDLKDGDILKVQCQAGIGGKVSIKVLK